MHPFTYLVPALFFNATVNTRKDLGTDTFGAELGAFEFESATLQSEPGFEFQFDSEVVFGTNYASTNSELGISHPDFRGTVVPRDGATPFKFHIGGVQIGNEALLPIITGNTSTGLEIPYGSVYRVLVATFQGGEGEYKSLENSVFVGTETVSDSGIPGKFLLGFKISKVYPTSTNITIGNEF